MEILTLKARVQPPQKDTPWNEAILSIVIKDLITSLEKRGSELYKQRDSLNLLVAVDEAHRLVPRETPDNIDAENMKHAFIDIIRTTRKIWARRARSEVIGSNCAHAQCWRARTNTRSHSFLMCSSTPAKYFPRLLTVGTRTYTKIH